MDLLLTDSVFGYRRGRGVHDAVAAVQARIANGASHFLDADIQKFFDNVDHDLLIDKIDRLGVDPRASKLLFRS